MFWYDVIIFQDTSNLLPVLLNDLLFFEDDMTHETILYLKLEYNIKCTS